MATEDIGAEEISEEALLDVLEERLNPVTEEAQEEVVDKDTDKVEEETEEVEEKEEEEQSDQEKDTDESKDEDPEKEADQSELTLAQIAEVLGLEETDLDVDDDGKVVLNTKIDGEEGRVRLADAKKSYQLEGHLNKQNMEVVEMRKAVQAEREQFQQERQYKTQALEDTLKLAVDELNRDYQNVNWDLLKQQDPSQFLVLKNEYQERQQSLGNKFQQIQQSRQEDQRKFDQWRVQAVSTELQNLRSSIPGWDKDDTYQEGAKEVRGALKEVGFTDQEIEAASQALSLPPEVAARMFKLADGYAKYQKLQQSKPEVTKKIRKAPKVVSSSARQETSKKATLQSAIDKVKKTGEGLEDYLEAKGII